MKWASLLLTVATSFAATTTTWEMTGYQDFLRGRISGLSLTRDGRLTLGSKLDTLFDSGQPEIWSVAQAPDGSLYLGTGHRGRLYKLDAAGKPTLVWTSDQSEIFAVTVDSKGVVYAGTSPDGKVYRIENGSATEYFSPGARYIWALKAAPDGSLFVGTGDQGKIFRVTSAGEGSVYYETGQSHVTCLELDSKNALLAGSEPNGILYRITAQNKAFVLYDANLPEIRAIVPAADGNLYVAALGGSVARRIGAANGGANAAGASAIAPVIATVTVTDQQAGLAPAPKPESVKTSVTLPTISTPASSVEYAGVDKSALYVIHADNTVETLWSSKDENIYDVAMFNSSLLFVTDVQGRLYRLDHDRKATLLAQSNEGEATRLLESRGALLAATGNLGKILRLDTGTVPTGWFESPVHDSSTVARWGRIAWRGDAHGIAFKTRSGNSLRPDATWSDWSAPLTDPDRAAITSPNARYIQWRAEFSGTSASAPSLDSVTIAYLPQNTPPNVRSINVTAVSGSSKSGPATAAAATASYAITVTDSGDAPATAGTPSQTLSRIPGQQVQIYWQADDPDGDRLLYNLYFRGEDESRWKLIRANMTENTYLLDADVFADGRYYFRVVASDALSNPANLAREAELVSAPILIDSTPPVVTASGARRNGAMVEIDVDAQDRGSVLRRCEYSLDAGQWMPVEAEDGVTDSARERFLIRLDKVSSGEHLVVIRVFDAAGNAGLTKVVVR
ncbi:MAG TPA: hypothetical protein VK752_02200 [Bryobacteraceae bacterium]|jgi:hypothetical protein|nr:hypothetical protein [Bryobacteraceae bacterium]